MNLQLIIHGIIRDQLMIIRVLFQIFPPPPAPYSYTCKQYAAENILKYTS